MMIGLFWFATTSARKTPLDIVHPSSDNFEGKIIWIKLERALRREPAMTAIPCMFHFPQAARRRRAALLVFLLTSYLVLPSPLVAWGSIGHMTVAYFAYQRLTPSTKGRVRDLLKLNPDYASWDKQIPASATPDDHDRMIFMIAATWADDIKGNSKYSDDGADPNTPSGVTSAQNIGYTDLFRHRYWHFIDLPLYVDGARGYVTPTPNAETQITAFRTVLSSTQPDDLKSYDLVWLLHLIGDVHQPLHSVTRVSPTDTKGDAGGNAVTLKGDASSNLHAYWDDLPGADCNFCNNKAHCLDRAEVLGKTLQTPTSKASKRTDAATWISESFTYARTQVYKTPIASRGGPFTIVPSSTYELAAQKLANKRLAVAGSRLAAVLNGELK